MPYPPLLMLPNEAAYEARFKSVYCCGSITTHDGIQVRFDAYKFRHDFFESSSRKKKKKDIFSAERSQRLLWIKEVLHDTEATLLHGWIKAENRHSPFRRVALVTVNGGHYAVVIALFGGDEKDHKTAKKGKFITAYVPEGETLTKIQKSPPWP